MADDYSLVNLEVIITIVVFAYGLLAIIYQVAIPEKLKGVNFSTKNKLLYFSRFVSISLGALTILYLMLWGIHFHWFELYKTTIDILLVILFMVIISAYFFFIKEITLQTALNDLSLNIIKRIKNDKVGNQAPKIPQELLVDLIHLGEEAKSGFEKNQALDALGRLIKSVQDNQNQQYQGNELADLIHGIEKILIEGPHNGDTDNIKCAGEILFQTFLWLQKREAFLEDYRHYLDVLLTLGIESLSFTDTSVLNRLLGYLTRSVNQQFIGTYKEVSQRLFFLGLAALEKRDDSEFHAVAVLCKLVALSGDAINITIAEGDFVKIIWANVLGLVAHFWMRGSCSKRHAQEVLSRIRDSYNVELKGAMEYAIEHYYMMAQFLTVDYLTKMRDDLFGKEDGTNTIWF